MVVVPTSKHVELTYTRSPIELLSMLLSLIGFALVLVFRRWWRPGRWTSSDWIGDRLYPCHGAKLDRAVSAQRLFLNSTM